MTDSKFHKGIRPSENSDGLFGIQSYSLKIPPKLFSFCACAFLFYCLRLMLADFGAAQAEQAHDVVFLVVAHALPVLPFVAVAQTAFAVALVVDFAHADAGAGYGEEIGLVHDGESVEFA